MTNERMMVGWREWVSLPALGLPAIKAKVDTGARTSALHAYFIDRYRELGRERLRFGIHPLQRRSDVVVICVADLIDQRIVSDSGGHRELRYVIETQLCVGDSEWPIELTLTNRDSMLFRMLLGRSAMHERLLVDPAISYKHGKLSARRLYGAGVRRRQNHQSSVESPRT